jgi:hypothetical protein
MSSKHKSKQRLPVRNKVKKPAPPLNAKRKLIIGLIGITILFTSVIFAIHYPIDYQKTISGPWGVLEEDPIVITPPASFVNSLNVYLEPSKQWVFRNTSLDKIRSLFLDAGIQDKLCDELINNTKPAPDGNSFVTTPPDSILWSFSPAIREKLYPVIGKSGNDKENSPYYVPYHFDFQNPAEWFYNSHLRQDLKDRLLRLVYHLYNTCCISDLHLMIPFIKNQAESESLLQIIFRTKALTVYLRIKEGEDIGKLVDYWGDFDRAQAITPLFESMRDNPGGGKIDIINILPPIPRIRLNTYVNARESQKTLRDCNWAAFNFFNDQSDERVNDSAQKPFLFKKLAKPLSPGKQPKFGDLILIKTDHNYILHSCVYIAEDLVYTKNGFTPHAPFILTSLANVMSFYRFYGGTKTTIYSRIVADTHQINP